MTPWGIEWWLWKRSGKKVRREIDARLADETPAAHSRVEEAIRFLVDCGLEEREVREGSMPAGSLDYVAAVVVDQLPADRPVRALHVGNFVGVSLCYFSWLVLDHHPESTVVSIDPNAPHRGIDDPQAHCVALLHHFGLLGCNLIIPSYTLERSEEWAATEADYEQGIACENALVGLRGIASEGFDLVLIDGNHDESYLAREVAAVQDLLTPSGIVVFDDITDWEGVAEVFGRTLRNDSFVTLGQDGRVGILQMLNTSHRRLAGDRR